MGKCLQPNRKAKCFLKLSADVHLRRLKEDGSMELHGLGVFQTLQYSHFSLSWRKQNLLQKNINLNKAFKESERDKLVMAPVITHSYFVIIIFIFIPKKEKQLQDRLHKSVDCIFHPAVRSSGSRCSSKADNCNLNLWVSSPGPWLPSY